MATTERTAIDVQVTRSGRWWSIRFPSMPNAFSQCRRLEQVDAFARESLALALDSEPSDVGPLDVRVEPPDDVATLIAASDRTVAEAQAAAERAANARRSAASGELRDSLPSYWRHGG